MVLFDVLSMSKTSKIDPKISNNFALFRAHLVLASPWSLLDALGCPRRALGNLFGVVLGPLGASWALLRVLGVLSGVFLVSCWSSWALLGVLGVLFGGFLVSREDKTLILDDGTFLYFRFDKSTEIGPLHFGDFYV